MRRNAMGLSISRAAKAASIARVTWTSVEDGSRETETYNYGPIERVLGWTAGSIEQVLAGGEPTLTEAEDAPPVDEQTSSADEILRMIIQILRSKVAADTKVRLIDRLIAGEYQPASVADLPDGPRHVAG